jgi:enolase
LAFARAAADSAGLPLFRYVVGPTPHPAGADDEHHNGGAPHPTPVDVQEFMIAPIGAPTFKESLRWGAEGTTR